MSNELKEIVKKIKFQTDKTMEQIAKDIGYTRAYFTDQVNKGNNSELKNLLIEKFMLESEHNVQNDSGQYQLDFKKAGKEDLLIALIKEKEYRIKKAEEWAEKFFLLLKSNLNSLSTHQALLSAQVMTILEREIDKEAKGDSNLKKKLMVRAYKQIDENYAGPSEADSQENFHK